MYKRQVIGRAVCVMGRLIWDVFVFCLLLAVGLFFALFALFVLISAGQSDDHAAGQSDDHAANVRHLWGVVVRVWKFLSGRRDL